MNKLRNLIKDCQKSYNNFEDNAKVLGSFLVDILNPVIPDITFKIGSINKDIIHLESARTNFLKDNNWDYLINVLKKEAPDLAKFIYTDITIGEEESQKIAEILRKELSYKKIKYVKQQKNDIEIVFETLDSVIICQYKDLPDFMLNEFFNNKLDIYYIENEKEFDKFKISEKVERR